MKISIFAFGKLKTPGLRAAADHYLKPLSAWVDIEEIELKPENPNDPQSDKRNEEKLLDLLERRMKNSRARVCVLDETGQTLTTTAWAKKLKEWEDFTDICLCIGASGGFLKKDSPIRKLSRESFSFGPQTLPHELARVVLFEQLFRAASLNHGHPYHNE